MDGAGLAAADVPLGQTRTGRLTSGVARAVFRQTEGVTHLADLFQRSPMRMLVPASDDAIPLAIIVNTAGGLVGGDHLESDIAVETGAAALVTSQAAEKVYRSTGADTRVSNRLSAESGAWLEWLPQDTILFDRCRLRRTMRIDAASGSRVLAGEILVFGRVARGEHLTAGLIHDAWDIYRDGRLAWADVLHLDGDIAAVLSNPSTFDGARACSTIVYVADDPAAQLNLVRAHLAGDVASGATCIGPVLLVRMLSDDAARLRAAFGRLWIALRHEIGGQAAMLPPIWHI